LAIAKHFPVVILTNVPALSPEKRNEAKRFVTLIDALYEHKTRLIITAQNPPEKIYEGGDGAFEFQRTVSRLVEIGSVGYLE
jgi:cell division protein ZapE